MKKFTLIIMLLISANLLWSQTYESIAEYGSSAYMIGLGNIEGFEHTPSAIFQNPAALSNLGDFSFSSMMSYMAKQDVSFYSLAFGKSFRNLSLTFGVLSLKSDNIKHTRVDGLDKFHQKQTFTYKNSVYKVGLKTTLKRTDLGVTAQYYYHPLFNTYGRGTNIDLGILRKLNKKTTLSVSLKNALIFNDIAYSNSQSEESPTQLVITTKDTYKSFNLYSQYKAHRSKSSLLAMGWEYNPKVLHSMFTVTLGWQQYHILQVKKSKFTSGIVIDMDALSFNVAYEPSEFVDQDHQFYFTLNFKL